MTPRSIPRQSLRFLLFLVIGIGSLTHPAGNIVWWALVGAVVALDGPWRTFIPFLMLSLFVELVGGLSLGTISLPFAVTTLVVAVAGNRLTLGPWLANDRWSLGPALRVWCVAVGSSIVMMIAAALLLAVAEGYLALPAIRAALSLGRIVSLAIVSACFLIVLRRIDIPFRTPIRFGT